MTKEEQILELVKKTIRGSEWENRVNLVGGAVRDEIMGKPVDDLDFVVEGNISAGLDFANWLCKAWKIFREGSNPESLRASEGLECTSIIRPFIVRSNAF
jgi:tRNA nucleotidyltransferase/poly(A) polymerase